MKVEVIPVGEIAANCLICFQEGSHEAILVDPGDEAWRIQKRCAELSVKPAVIVLTHGHFDHIQAAEELAEHYGIPVHAGEKEGVVLESPRANLTAMFSRPLTLDCICDLKDEEEYTWAGLTFTVLHTPGHTPGGICLYFREEKVLVTGDTLFCGSFGRTDFPGGNPKELALSVQRLFELPDDTVCYPGHEDETTIGREKRANPIRAWFS